MDFNTLLPIPKGLEPTAFCTGVLHLATSSAKVGITSGTGGFLTCLRKGGFAVLHNIMWFSWRHLVERPRCGDIQEGILCIFVDCTKAFDTARRELMLRRCEEVGPGDW